MPRRIFPFISDQVYHIYNRGIDHRITFSGKRELDHAVNVINYYRFAVVPVKFSIYNRWPESKKNELRRVLKNREKNIEILSYCLMPNHFHFLLRQKTENGISKYLSNFQNSFTRYSNTKHKRIGPLFLDQFKAIRIETDDQLLHVSRYIHLNPYSSFIVKTIDQLIRYSWSSLPQYIRQSEGICDVKNVLSFFKNSNVYKDFVVNQADYQRKLDRIKHLTFE